MPFVRDAITYTDTRGLSQDAPTFSEVLIKGIAPGGGLFVPVELPSFTVEEILAFAELPYWQRATTVFSRFGVDIPEDRIGSLMRESYGDNFDDSRIAPVTEVVAGMHVLELWHGSTSAFKDMALQCMPVFFSESVDMLRKHDGAEDDFLILVATSGDTGKAALDGFASRDHTNIIVFYPSEGVSDIQRLQMVTQRGDNVGVFGVRGNFDDCQNAVKAAFNDDVFNTWLHEEHELQLSSANSINWGRLLPQIAYYVSAYADMVAEGGVKPGEPMDVCVPTGNFGNILGAYYARQIGVPIGRLLCASNENNVLADFVATGLYDISDRGFVTTPSPSMDILISSNLERLLYELADAESVREWMEQLSTEGRFQVDRDTFGKLREVFVGDWVSNDTSLATIRRVFDETGYLMDPHTAVAWEVAERLRGEDPVLIVSTAHWAKFGAAVYKALNGILYGDELPDEAASFSGVALLAEVQRSAPNACAPKALATLLEQEQRFTEIIDSGADGIKNTVKEWLAR